MRQVHISQSLVYPAVSGVPHITIDNTTTSDSYPAFVTAHFAPQQYEWRLRLLKPCLVSELNGILKLWLNLFSGAYEHPMAMNVL